MNNIERKEQTPVIFMNRPISKAEEDVIGFSTIVKNLKAAIDGGAQMIGLTSPFGTGKTSVTELLEKEYAGNKKIKVVRVSMWSHISEENRKKEGNKGNVLPLADVRQTKALIENIFERNEAFVLEYMLHIDGFQDKEAASVFVEYVLSRETFLRSQELYDHTYEKLVDGALKSRYTRARRKREMAIV